MTKTCSVTSSAAMKPEARGRQQVQYFPNLSARTVRDATISSQYPETSRGSEQLISGCVPSLARYSISEGMKTQNYVAVRMNSGETLTRSIFNFNTRGCIFQAQPYNRPAQLFIAESGKQHTAVQQQSFNNTSTSAIPTRHSYSYRMMEGGEAPLGCRECNSPPCS